MQQLTFEEVRALVEPQIYEATDPEIKDQARKMRWTAEKLARAKTQESHDFVEHAHSLMASWLDRGDGIAVYRNEALDSVLAGHLQFVSFGSKMAQLETDCPPDRLPDIGNRINWAYCLEGVCLPKGMQDD